MLEYELFCGEAPNEVLDMVCQLANHYLAPEQGGYGSEKSGIVEKPFTLSLLRHWLGFSGTRLFYFRESKTKAAAGFLLGCLPGQRIPEEAGSCATAVQAFNRKHSEQRSEAEAFWVYYLVTTSNRKSYGARICIAIGEWLKQQGITLVVADYMIATAENPHSCGAGERIMRNLLGFEVVDVQYDNAEEDEYLSGEIPYMRFEITVRDLLKSNPAMVRLLKIFPQAL